jgi:hypothetical protein
MELAPKLRSDFRRAFQSRQQWEAHWRECYRYALPQRETTADAGSAGGSRVDRLFDATAADAVDQLAASLLSELTPPWARWLELCPGTDVAAEERGDIAPALDRASAVLQSHFDRSNFAVEVHQCFLDLVTAGTACLLFEEAPLGEASAFRFTAVPIHDVVLEEGPTGRLDRTWRRLRLTPEQFARRYSVEPPDAGGSENPPPIGVLESVQPGANGYRYVAIREQPDGDDGLLAEGEFASSPFINFRWVKAPGEGYGRSPVMKALPDIKTANKVVELVLKNASIAVTGIWQADDDGVLNPAAVKLVPGAIIPKAVGSAGLAPLDAPGRFDVSELVLSDLRARIKHALLVDRLGVVQGPRMTATEVLERAAEMGRILGATYGRLQAELLGPLVARALSILRRRGEIGDLAVDGRVIDLRYRSPLAEAQRRADAQSALQWIQTVAALGPEAMGAVDLPAFTRWFGEQMAVPSGLIKPAVDIGAGAAVDMLAQVASVLGPAIEEALVDGG